MAHPTGTRLLLRWIYVMVKLGEEFLLVNQVSAGVSQQLEEEYGPDFPPFLAGFLDALDGEDWPPGSYFPGGFFRRHSRPGGDPRQIPLTREAVKPFYLEEMLIDKNGVWFSGEKKLSGRVLEFFLKNLEFDPLPRRYRVRYRLEHRFEVNYLHHRSPPFRVSRVVPSQSGLSLLLNNGLTLPLRGDSLWLDDREQLHAGVGNPPVGARFGDAARWELLKDAEEDDGRWVVTLENQRVALAQGGAWPFADDPPDTSQA